MNHIYHRVPKDMTGDILYPLNELRNIHPAAYDYQVKKYKGREQLLEQRISVLGSCLWNDVLFFTPAQPSDVFEARRQAGFPDMAPQQYFKLNPHELDHSKLGVFLFHTDTDATNHQPRDYAEYRYEDLEKYAQIPQATRDYFRQEFEDGQTGIRLFYRYIPHILHKGPIDVSEAEVIEVK